jgi:hypothetical protein
MGIAPSLKQVSAPDVTLPQVFGEALGGQTNGSVSGFLTSPARADSFKVALHCYIGALPPPYGGEFAFPGVFVAFSGLSFSTFGQRHHDFRAILPATHAETRHAIRTSTAGGQRAGKPGCH